MSTDLHFAYPDGTAALSGVSVPCGHGESIAIVGRQRRGKSTLLMHLNGFSRRTGTVSIGGVPVTRSTLSEMPQDRRNGVPGSGRPAVHAEVAEDVAFGPMNLGLSETDVRPARGEALERVGSLGSRTARPIGCRAARSARSSIATVLAMSPEHARDGRAELEPRSAGTPKADRPAPFIRAHEDHRHARPRPGARRVRADDRDARRARSRPMARPRRSSATRRCSTRAVWRSRLRSRDVRSAEGPDVRFGSQTVEA